MQTRAIASGSCNPKIRKGPAVESVGTSRYGAGNGVAREHCHNLSCQMKDITRHGVNQHHPQARGAVHDPLATVYTNVGTVHKHGGHRTTVDCWPHEAEIAQATLSPARDRSNVEFCYYHI